MSEKGVRQTFAGRSPSAAASASFSLIFFAAAVLSCACSAAGQGIKTALISTTLESTSFPRWLQDLGYRETQLYPLVLAASGCPFMDVDVSGVKVSLGNGRSYIHPR
jgi:hypothetical protein